jgi:hypothetical protein
MWTDKMAAHGPAVLDQYGNGFAQGPDRRAALSLWIAGIDLRAFAMQPGNRGPAGQIKPAASGMASMVMARRIGISICPEGVALHQSGDACLGKLSVQA